MERGRPGRDYKVGLLCEASRDGDQSRCGGKFGEKFNVLKAIVNASSQ